MANEYYFDPDDKLDRFGYAKFLRDLIENCDQYKRDESSEAYSIAIDSSWGTGKTYFFKMFENYLYGKKCESDDDPEGNPEFIVVNYNAWSNDYWDDAFAPFMQNILDNDRFMGTETSIKIRRILESIIQSTDYATTKIYDNYRTNSPLTHFSQRQRAMQDLKDCLKKMIKDCQDSGLRKLVIIIDELDRCKPLFAIQTLEIVKHFLDVKDVVFIFAVDLEQLSHSIESVYGSGMDASGYLCKFFDYITKFPPTSVLQLIRNSISEVQNIITIVVNSNSENLDAISKISNFIHVLYTSYSLSIRDIQTILKSYQIMLHSFLNEYQNEQAHKLYLLFLVIKYKFPSQYQTLLTKPAQRSSILNSLLTTCCDYYLSDSYLNAAIEVISNNSQAYIVHNRTGYDRRIDISNIDYYRASTLTVVYYDIFLEIRNEYEPYGVLFYPDFKNLYYLKSASFADYIFTRLENFDFPDIIKSPQ